MKRKFFCVLLISLLIINFYCIDSNLVMLGCISKATTIDQNSTFTTSTSYDEDLGICAESCLLMDQKTGKVLYDKNGYSKMYPASTTKTMTAILTVEKLSDLTQMVNVSYYAVHSVPATYSIANLQPGEKFSVKDLLNALLIASANDAAYVLAEYIANNGNNYSLDSSGASKEAFLNSMSEFSDMMNAKAKEIGCTDTNFVNPNGVHNENHYSTAYDLALIGKYAYNNSTIMSVVSTLKYSLNNSALYSKDVRSFTSTNLLLHSEKSGYYKYANGLKTGYTDAAKYCIISSAKKDDRSLIAVILHSENTTDASTSRESDCKKLFEYGFNNFSNSTLIAENSVATTLHILNGSSDSKDLNLVAKNSISVLIKTNDGAVDVTPEIHVNKYFAPIAKGEVVGTITYSIYGIDYSSDLIAEHDVYSTNYLTFILILLTIFATLFLGLTIVNSKNKKRRRR